MSIHPPQPTQALSQDPYRIAIIASNYNAHFVNSLIQEAQKEILLRAPQTTITVLRVPGAFEIPLAVKLIAERQKPDAILALGLLIRGETSHADLIGNAITQHLLPISLHYSIPIIHEVLLLDNTTQATERCLGDRFNRGAEAARAALSMINLIENISSF